MANVAPNQFITVTEPTLITPVMPSASLNGSVTLTRSLVIGAAYQWRFGGVDLVGQTNRTLNLTNIVAGQQGRYSVVVSDATSLVTNYAYLTVDTQFTQIKEGSLVTDLGCSWGGSWGDYNGDGFADLFVPRNNVGRPALYRNNHDGTFTPAASTSLPGTTDTWASSAWADLDNDGRPDLVATRYNKSPSVYFNNGDGNFSPLSFVGVAPWSIAVADYNQDGLLDVLLSSGSTSDGPKPCVLFGNNGDRTFTRMSSQQVGSIVSTSTFGAAAWGDYDDDGWPDLYSPHVFALDRIFHNDGAGRFATVSNLLTQSSAVAGAWGDYDNDGRIDLCAADWDAPSYVYRNLGNGNFERATIGLPISGNFQSVSWADYDNDGFLDLFLAGQGNQLYHNNGDGTFTRITTGSIVTDSPVGGDPFWSYSALWFDYDNNGFLDLYVSNGNDPLTANVANFLYHNNANSNAWLKVKLVGTTSNRDAIGAKVRALATYAGQSRWQRRDISSGDGYNGNHLLAHFGLGNAELVTTLRIEWPSGTVQEIPNVATNQMLTVVEPRRPVLALEATPTGFTGMLKADTNQTYQVHASDDLTTGWTVLTNVTSDATGTAVWSDSAPAPHGRRFYKAVKTP